MKYLSYGAYQRLVEGGRTLALDTYGPKVIETKDGRIVKLFRTKRRFSLARWKPYAKRFARNAGRLMEIGIPTVEVLGVHRVMAIQRDVVVYRRLKGETLRDHLRGRHGAAENVLPRLAVLLAELHRHGILFRSIHFGNVLVMPDGTLGLIDVADMRKRLFGASTLRQRVRNFRHMLRYAEDCQVLVAYGIERFIAEYAFASKINQKDVVRLNRALRALTADLQS